MLAVIPLFHFIGCKDDASIESSIKKDLKKLIIAFGPWPSIDRSIAEDFAERFVNAHHLTQSYLHKKADLLITISNKIPKNSISIESLDLSKFSSEEHDLIMNLCDQIYNLVEVRYFISNMPPWGECQIDELFYSKMPS